jgi:hypothetical protein
MLSPAEPKLCCPAHVSCPSKPQFPRMRFGGNCREDYPNRKLSYLEDLFY